MGLWDGAKDAWNAVTDYDYRRALTPSRGMRGVDRYENQSADMQAAFLNGQTLAARAVTPSSSGWGLQYGDYVNQLQNQQGPTAAQAMLQNAQNQAQQNTMAAAMANPAVNPALAQRSALGAGMQAQRQAGLDATMLRAQEEQQRQAMLIAARQNQAGLETQNTQFNVNQRNQLAANMYATAAGREQPMTAWEAGLKAASATAQGVGGIMAG